nr:hypothetical protein 1 [bacterium]
MHDIDFYIDEAKRNLFIETDKGLADALGLTKNSVCGWRKGRIYPKMETMLDLAHYAKVKSSQAIEDLNRWKNKKSMPIVFDNIIKKASKSTKTNMRDINFYLDAAKKHLQVDSDRGLSKKLGYTTANVCNWRKERSFPPETLIIQLSEWAGVPAEQALLDLTIWRASEEARPIYERMFQRVTEMATVTAVALPLLTASPAYAKKGELTNSLPIRNTQAIEKQVNHSKASHFTTYKLSSFYLCWILRPVS